MAHRGEDLYEQHAQGVYRYLFSLGADADTAEDLTQETFLSAYLHRDAIPPGYERQWLCRVATNKAKDFLSGPEEPGYLPGGLQPPDLALRHRQAALV